MKTVRMFRDFDYRPTKHFLTAYRADVTYTKVPEAAAKSIVEAGAGDIVGEKRKTDDEDAGG